MPAKSKDNGEKQVRIDIGFAGGQALTVRATKAQLDGLRKALTGDGSWFDLETDDGHVALDLGQLCFLKTDTDSGRVGF